MGSIILPRPTGCLHHSIKAHRLIDYHSLWVDRLATASTIRNVPISNDTTPEAERYYTKFLRSLTGEEKVRMAVEMTETANQVCKQGIAHRHPSYTEEEIHYAFLRIIWGHELYAQVHPSGPFLTP